MFIDGVVFIMTVNMLSKQLSSSEMINVTPFPPKRRYFYSFDSLRLFLLPKNTRQKRLVTLHDKLLTAFHHIKTVVEGRPSNQSAYHHEQP